MSRRTIYQWIEGAVVGGSHRNFDDLHVDEIDPKFKDTASWVPASLDALTEGARIRDQKGWPFTIALAIPLVSSPRKGTPKPSRIEELTANLGSTPPSLYAFERGDEPWRKSTDEFERLPHLTVSDETEVAYLSERFDSEEGEYQRTVWVAR